MMNDRERFEEELAGFAPRQPSPELTERIAVRVAETRARVWRRRAITVAVATIAAGILVVAWPNPSVPKFADMVPLIPIERDESLPTVWSYRQAMNESPEALEAMLDAQSLRTLPSSEPVRVSPFSGLEPDFLSGGL